MAGPPPRCRALPIALSAEQITALAELVYTPLPSLPDWTMADIEASRIFDAGTVAALPDKPVFSADPLNLFVVVESGDHHVTILDGDRFEPIHRFPSRFALHGGPKFSATAAMSSSDRGTAGSPSTTSTT